jgi:hypothetical protein
VLDFLDTLANAAAGIADPVVGWMPSPVGLLPQSTPPALSPDHMTLPGLRARLSTPVAGSSGVDKHEVGRLRVVPPAGNAAIARLSPRPSIASNPPRIQLPSPDSPLPRAPGPPLTPRFYLAIVDADAGSLRSGGLCSASDLAARAVELVGLSAPVLVARIPGELRPVERVSARSGRAPIADSAEDGRPARGAGE